MGWGSGIRDPRPEIRDPGSEIRDPRSGIRDPEKTYCGSRIQGSKRHRIPDPDPQHCVQESLSLPFSLYNGSYCCKQNSNMNISKNVKLCNLVETTDWIECSGCGLIGPFMDFLIHNLKTASMNRGDVISKDCSLLNTSRYLQRFKRVI